MLGAVAPTAPGLELRCGTGGRLAPGARRPPRHHSWPTTLTRRRPSTAPRLAWHRPPRRRRRSTPSRSMVISTCCTRALSSRSSKRAPAAAERGRPWRRSAAAPIRRCRRCPSGSVRPRPVSPTMSATVAARVEDAVSVAADEQWSLETVAQDPDRLDRPSTRIGAGSNRMPSSAYSGSACPAPTPSSKRPLGEQFERRRLPGQQRRIAEVVVEDQRPGEELRGGVDHGPEGHHRREQPSPTWSGTTSTSNPSPSARRPTSAQAPPDGAPDACTPNRNPRSPIRSLFPLSRCCAARAGPAQGGRCHGLRPPRGSVAREALRPPTPDPVG